MLAKYLNQQKPLVVVIGTEKLVFKNMNVLTASEINEIFETTRRTQKFSAFLRSLLIEGDETLLSKLSTLDNKQIFEEWETHSGVTVQEILEVFYVIEHYEQELQADLNGLTNVKTITEFLSLTAVDMVGLTKSLLDQHKRKSFIAAKVEGLVQPFSPENNTELISLTLLNALRSIFKGKPIELSMFAIESTDTEEEPETIEDEAIKAVKEATIQNWITNGTIKG
jgi:hypothetical protein